MSLRGADLRNGTDIEVSSMQTFAAPGNTTYKHDPPVPHAVHGDVAYFVRVTSGGWATAAGDLRIRGVEINYILPGGYVS